MGKATNIKALENQFRNKSRSKKIQRETVVYFLIVCEGAKTEPNYFKSFPKQIGKVVYDIQFDGGGINTMGVVNKAIEIRDNTKQKYDRVWAVFDRDSFKPNVFNSAILKAKAQGIECAWSNEAFELWYLLHFQNRVTAMDRAQYQKAIEDAVNIKMGKGNKKYKYEKNVTNTYDILRKYGNQELAIRYAKSLDNNSIGEQFANYNPNTQVYKLVEELIGKSTILNEEIKINMEYGR